MLGLRQAGIQKKCGYCCRKLPLDCFASRVVKGEEVVYSKCETCRPKHLKSSHTSANNAENNKRFKQSEKGKASEKRFKQSEKGKASNKRYAQSEKGKAAMKRKNQSEKGKASNKRYAQSEKGKAKQKSARQSEKGKASRKRFLETKKKRRAADPAYCLMGNISRLAVFLVSLEKKNSPAFVKRTSFTSGANFRNHIRREAAKRGWTLADHGTKFQIEHKIPQEAFDFNDTEDVKRCWSHANVHAMTKEENMAKSYTIVDALCLDVGAEKYPKAWGGRIPSEEEKQAFYAKCRAAFSQAGPSAGNDYASSEEKEPMEEDSDSDS